MMLFVEVERHVDGVGPGEFRRRRQGARSSSSYLDARHRALQLVSFNCYATEETKRDGLIIEEAFS